MLVRMEVEFDDTEFSIIQRDALATFTAGASADIAVAVMGQCAGRMIAAIVGSSAPIDTILEHFAAVVDRAAKNPSGSACLPIAGLRRLPPSD